MHDDQGPVEKEGRDGGPLKLPYLTVWTLNDRFFAFLVHCMLRRVLSEYWRKETENRKFFGGVVGLDGRCSAQAEQRKKPVAVVHLPGAYLSTETNLVPIRGVMKKEFDTGHTRTHAHGMKTATHGPDEGRLDLQKSVLIRGAKSFASPPQPSRRSTMATPKVLRVRHSPPARWRCEMGTIVLISQQEQI